MNSNIMRKFNEKQLEFLKSELDMGEPIPYDDPLFELIDMYDADLDSEMEGRVRATRAKLIFDGIR